MGEGYVNARCREVDDGVQARCGHVVVEQVFESVAAQDAPAVVEDGEPCVQVGVVAEHVFDKLSVEAVVLEEALVGLEEGVGAVFFLARPFLVAHEHPFLEYRLAHLPVAHTAGDEARGKGVHRLQTHTVHAHRGGEHGRVILAAGVELRHGIDQRAEGNAAPVVAYFGRQVVVDGHLDALAVTFVELVDAVVYAFLEQHVDAVFGMGTVAQTADVHAGTGSDVLGVFEVSDFTLVVNDFGSGGGGG